MIETQTIPSVETMPEKSRVWVFQSNRMLNGDEIDFIASNLKLFLPSWAAHGKSLFATYEIRYERFLVIYLDEEQAGATGCSIDKLMNLIAAFEEKLQLSFRDRMQVVYKSEDSLKDAHLNDLSKLAQEGAIDKSTTVFNNLVEDKKSLKESWETTVADSWHARFIE